MERHNARHSRGSGQGHSSICAPWRRRPSLSLAKNNRRCDAGFVMRCAHASASYATVPQVPVRRVSGAVPILMYHQVSPRPHPAFRKYTVMPGAFARQMAWLARTGHVAISLDLLAGSRAGRAALPSRPVVITFDDGFRESVEHATPVLAKHGFTATSLSLSPGSSASRARGSRQSAASRSPSPRGPSCVLW